MLLLVLSASGCSTVNSFRYAVKYDHSHYGYKSSSHGGGVYHTMHRGETPYRIAKTYGIPVKELLRVNRIADPYTLSTGTKLWIPGARYVKHVPPSFSAPRYKSFRKTKRYASLRRDFKRKNGHTRSSFRRPFISNKKYLWPVEGGTLTSRYGIRHKRKHDGIDIGAPAGRRIYVVDDGEVLFSGVGPTGYGKIIIVRHSKRLVTVYAHCSRLIARKGEKVRKGAVIAKVGSTGRSTGPHLHFEFRVDKKAVNPLKYIPDRPTGRYYVQK